MYYRIRFQPNGYILPYRFPTEQEAQNWIDNYQVSSEYKQNYVVFRTYSLWESTL